MNGCLPVTRKECDLLVRGVLLLVVLLMLYQHDGATSTK